jgi:hypothetical protein
MNGDSPMKRHRSPEEVLDHHLQVLGPALGVVYNSLFNDVSWLHDKWKQYRILFAASEKRIALLNEIAGFFFYFLQETIFEGIVLNLARLTDPIQTGRGGQQQENLTIQSLPSLVKDPDLSKELEELVNTALNTCSSFRMWRNKRFAHRDLKLALAKSGDPLPGISRADIEKALDSFRTLLNKLEQFYFGSRVDYRMMLPEAGDAECVIYYLRKGLRAEHAKQMRLRTGKPLPEDLAPDEEE